MIWPCFHSYGYKPGYLALQMTFLAYHIVTPNRGLVIPWCQYSYYVWQINHNIFEWHIDCFLFMIPLSVTKSPSQFSLALTTVPEMIYPQLTLIFRKRIGDRILSTHYKRFA